MTKTLYDAAVEERGIEKGIEQGIEKGIEKGKIEVALKSIAKGLDPELIADLTGLTIPEIDALREL